MAIRIALAQRNAAVGDLYENAEKVQTAVQQAQQQNADFVIFPELFLCGYPPEDLLHRPRFLRDTQKALQSLAENIDQIAVLVGTAENTDTGIFNTAAWLRDRNIQQVYRKAILPNYGVFDEKRYFQPGREPLILEVKGVRFAITICEDIWNLKWLDGFLENEKFDCIINISASPFHVGKIHQRKEILSRCAVHFKKPLIYCNLIGGQDELVFDGRSMILDQTGRVLAQAAAFKEDLLFVELTEQEQGLGMHFPQSESVSEDSEVHDPVAECWYALVLGTRDYVQKNGFSKVLIGISGGIDSALTAAIAVEAIGRENVQAITMPSRFNSSQTRSDAKTLAENLNIAFQTIPIGSILESFSTEFACVPGWDENGIAYENLQARIRGTILMSLSNQFGYLVLTTGNKSETAVGYSTLYGDTAGGFAVIKDVPKTMVYQLCRYFNRTKNLEIIPQSIIDRIPSAELRENQKDSDSLPDYDLLDRILKGYVEEECSIDEMIQKGLPPDSVERIYGMVDRNEYKRRQCPPGIKITPRAFGKDRRMPITNRYRSRRSAK